MTDLIVYILVCLSAVYVLKHVKKTITRGDAGANCRNCPAAMKKR